MSIKEKAKQLKNIMKKHLIATIDCIGGCVVIATFIPIFFVGALGQSILISISINIFTSLLVLTFVDRILDSQRKKEDEQKKKSDEKEKILRYHKTIEHDLQAYIVEFNQLTTPYSKRKDNGDKLPFQTEGFNADFVIQDLSDFNMIDLSVYSSYSIPVLEALSKFQSNVFDSFTSMLKNIDFEYYKGIEDSVNAVVRLKSFPTGIENLCMIINQARRGKDAFLKSLQKMISTYSGDPHVDLKEGKYNGNLFLNVLLLFSLLLQVRNVINKYIMNIGEIKEKA